MRKPDFDKANQILGQIEKLKAIKKRFSVIDYNLFHQDAKKMLPQELRDACRKLVEDYIDTQIGTLQAEFKKL